LGKGRSILPLKRKERPPPRKVLLRRVYTLSEWLLRLSPLQQAYYTIRISFASRTSPYCANKNSGPFLKIRCKINTKVTLVYLQRQKFFKKIVFSPFSGLIKEPFDGGIYSFRLYPVLRSHGLACLMCRSTLVSRHKIIIDYGLIAYFYLMPFLRHPIFIRVSYQVRYVI